MLPEVRSKVLRKPGVKEAPLIRKSVHIGTQILLQQGPKEGKAILFPDSRYSPWARSYSKRQWELQLLPQRDTDRRKIREYTAASLRFPYQGKKRRIQQEKL